jgi:release factor glutamine methyltransferase
MKIKEIYQKYRHRIDIFDLELIIAHTLGKNREFVLTHLEYRVPQNRISKLKKLIKRRLKHEPIAYIFGQKEFFGLDFKVNRHTLIPRPETEMLVEEVLKFDLKNKIIIDVGTGSGNIIISIAHNIRHKKWNNVKFFATDISAGAIKIAKENAKIHKVSRKIKFIRGNLLTSFIPSTRHQTANTSIIIVANLPYLSKKIYDTTTPDIKKYEPRSALVSEINGLDHYQKLLRQIKKIIATYPSTGQTEKPRIAICLEFNPEQKSALQILIKFILSDVKTEFKKDLTGKWRFCRILL